MNSGVLRVSGFANNSASLGNRTKEVNLGHEPEPVHQIKVAQKSACKTLRAQAGRVPERFPV